VRRRRRGQCGAAPAVDGSIREPQRLGKRARAHKSRNSDCASSTNCPLRKKVRQGLLQSEQAEELWERFLALPIDFVDTPDLRIRAWEIAERFGLSTLYDAAFLACVEVSPAAESAVGEFWTADRELVRQLGDRKPPYVQQLVG